LKKCWTILEANGCEVVVVGMSVYDNAPFYMLTTADYNFELTEGGTGNALRFDIVHCYNKNTHGNDIADALLSAFSTNIRSKKYWVRLFHFFLDVGANNAYIIFRLIDCLKFPQAKASIEHSKFIEDLVQQLVMVKSSLNNFF